MVINSPFSLSKKKVFLLVLLNPNFSSITKVLYNENGILIISLPILIIPKKIKVMLMMLSENSLAIESKIENPSKKKKLSVVVKENNEVILLKL
jgi:nickel-dependent lactate racemase